MDKWERWIEDDWYRSYVLKLGKLGLNFDSTLFDRARDRLKKGMVHRNMLGSGAFWMLNFWRMDGLDERDFEWFEERYPGWYAEYGAVWEAFRATRHDPQQFKHLMNMALESASPSCWVCLMGCVFEEDMCHRAVDGHTRFYCSKECKWLDESNPGRYVGDRNYFDRYHGWEISELVRHLGYVRSDGETLVAAAARERRPDVDPLGPQEHGLPHPEPEHRHRREARAAERLVRGPADPQRPHRRRAAGGRAVDQVERAAAAGERGGTAG